jgi:hypothetical protein
MRRDTHIKKTAITVLMGAALVSAGCIEYNVDTTLLPNGSGAREIRVELQDAEDNQDLGLSEGDFRALMGVGERDGWAHETHIDAGDTTHVFLKEDRIGDLGSWSRLSDGIHIRGALPNRSAERLGYVTLGDIRFSNQVLVGTSRKSDGSSAHDYVETFRWENGVEAILEIMLKRVESALDLAYPTLAQRARGEIMGTARARFQGAVEAGVFDDDDQWDDLWNQAIQKTATQAIHVVKESYPNESEEGLRTRIDIFSGDLEEGLERAFSETLPGLNLSFSAEITFRLTMPGQVTSTNAHERDGNVLVWEFSPGDALTSPVVLVAESVLQGGTGSNG